MRTVSLAAVIAAATVACSGDIVRPAPASQRPSLALAPAPTEAEAERARKFLAWAGAQIPAAAAPLPPPSKPPASPWAELAHAMFNLKEFIFLR